MQYSFAEKFTIGRVNQRVRCKNFFKRGKRSARSKQQAASREFHALFLRSGFKLTDCAVSQPLCLGLHSRNELACLPEHHLFCRVVGLAELIRKRFYEVDALPRQDYRCASIDAHGDNRRPPRMHTKPHRRLFQMTHCEHLLRLRTFHDFLREFPCSCFVLWVTEYFGRPPWLGLYTVSNFVLLERQADTPDQPDVLAGPTSAEMSSGNQPFCAASSSP